MNMVVQVRPTAGRWMLALAVALLFGLSIASILIGVGNLSNDAGSHAQSGVSLLFASRIPRTLAIILTGAGLAVAGLVMQTISRNRFVEPMTAGTGQSAALGLILVTILFPGASLASKSLAACLVAVVGTWLFLRLARRLPPTEPYLVPLFGLIFGGIIDAIVTGIAWQADLLQFQEIWRNGEFSGVLQGRYELLWLAAAMVAAAFWAADRLTLLSLGRDASVGLGLNYEAMVRLGLVIVSVISALTVVTVGILPFVGLVVPALIARLAGDNVRSTLVMVGVGGALLVLAADIIARTIRFPYEVPVATVLGIVGAIVFLAILVARHVRD
jgi:iron complex transport system permease protein